MRLKVIVLIILTASIIAYCSAIGSGLKYVPENMPSAIDEDAGSGSGNTGGPKLVPADMPSAIDEDARSGSGNTGGPKLVPTDMPSSVEYEPLPESAAPQPASGGAAPRTEPGKTAVNSVIEYQTPSWYAPISGEPIRIRKDIVPVETGKYGVIGGTLRVYVELTNLKGGDLKGIHVLELLDDEFRVVAVPGTEAVDKPRSESRIRASEPYTIDDMRLCKLGLFREGKWDLKKVKGLVRVGEDYEIDLGLNPMVFTEEYLLFNWSNSSDEVEKMEKLLRGAFGIKWLKNNSTTIEGPDIIKREDRKNDSQITITSKSDPGDWLTLLIEDIDALRPEGSLTLNISGDRYYDLVYKYENKLISVYDYNTYFRIDEDELHGREKLIYVYYIKPKRSGLFNIESMIRVYDRAYSSWPDIIYPYEVTVREPDMNFNVVPLLSKDRVYSTGLGGIFDDELDLKYEIRYAGNTLDQYIDNISVKIDESPDGDYNFTNSNKTRFNLNFIEKNPWSIESTINYRGKGVYRLPGLWIENVHYTFPDKITVDDPFDALIDKITTFNTIIIIIGTFLARKEIAGSWRYIKRKLRRRSEEDNGSAQAGEESDEEIIKNINAIMGRWSERARDQDQAKEQIAALRRDLETLTKEVRRKEKGR